MGSGNQIWYIIYILMTERNLYNCCRNNYLEYIISLCNEVMLQIYVVHRDELYKITIDDPLNIVLRHGTWSRMVREMICHLFGAKPLHDSMLTILFTHETELVVGKIYRQVSNIRRTLVGNKIVDHSDVVGASPVGAAPTTSSFST